MSYSEFRLNILKAIGTHKFSVTNSYGTKLAWRWIKKNKWLNIGLPITEKQFGLIIKEINQTLLNLFLEGKDIVLPHKLGRIELRKFEDSTKIVANKLVTNLPVDWKRTLELWYSDEEYLKLKKLVRFEGKERFMVYYNKTKAAFNNKSFYLFIPTRTFKRKLTLKINEGLDALLLGKKNELYKHKTYNG